MGHFMRMFLLLVVVVCWPAGAADVPPVTRPSTGPTTRPSADERLAEQFRRLIQIREQQVRQMESGLGTRNTPRELLRARFRLADARSRFFKHQQNYEAIVREFREVTEQYEKALVQVKRMLDAGRLNPADLEEFETEVIEVRMRLIVAESDAQSALN